MSDLTDRHDELWNIEARAALAAYEEQVENRRRADALMNPDAASKAIMQSATGKAGYATPGETAEAFKNYRDVGEIFKCAERYRWLVKQGGAVAWLLNLPDDKAEADAVIDAAMKEKP